MSVNALNTSVNASSAGATLALALAYCSQSPERQRRRARASAHVRGRALCRDGGLEGLLGDVRCAHAKDGRAGKEA